MSKIISQKTVLSIKMDKKVKEEAQSLARDMGLNLSLIINASLKQFVERKEILFSKTYTMTPYLERVIKEAQAEYDRGESAGPFYTVEDAMKYLNS